MENSKERLEDEILILNSSLKAAKEQRVSLEKFCQQIADIMDLLKTDSAKQELAEITQTNYAKMIELDVNIGQMEKTIKMLKFTAGIMGI